MIKLSDTQCILLSHAAQRDTGSLLPLPTTIKPGGGASRALAALLAQDLAEERETSDASATRRVDGDVRYGVFITVTGASAIGVEPSDGGGSWRLSLAGRQIRVRAQCAA